MSDPNSRGDLPSERDLPPGWAPGASAHSPSRAGESGEARSDSTAVPGEDPGEVASYDAMPDVDEDEVIDISDNSGPDLTTGVADIDSGAAGGRSTAARGDDSGTETPRRAIPDDEP